MGEFPGFRQAHFVADMGQIQSKLTRDLVSANRTSGLAAVVFAHAKKPFTQTQIFPLECGDQYAHQEKQCL